MSCDLCKDIVDQIDRPHVVRICTGCGREMHIVEKGEHGQGIVVKAGDRFVIPSSWLKLSLNPLKSTGQFFRSGLQWFASMIFVGDLTKSEANLKDNIDHLEKQTEEILRNSKLLAGLNIEDPSHADQIVKILQENKNELEWWAFGAGAFLSIYREAAATGQVDRAAWAIACVERFRSMIIFKEELEEVVWMGSSARKVIDALTNWDANRQNAEEGFWQAVFTENTYVLSQVFAVPLVFIKDRAYVGGMKVDGKEAKFVDYLFSIESSREAILVEIKTPLTKLLGSEYRSGVYPPSTDLSGGVAQVLAYRTELVRNFVSIASGREVDFSAFSPRCVLLAGNAKEQLKDENMQRSFELFRSNLKDVEIITYDELFRKVEVLANLFNLIRPK